MAEPGQAAAQPRQDYNLSFEKTAPQPSQYDLTLEDHQFLADEGGGYTWEDVDFLEQEGGSVDPALREMLESESTPVHEGIPTPAELAEAGVQPDAPEQPLPAGAPLAEPPAQQMLGAPAAAQPLDPQREELLRQRGLAPTGEPEWVTNLSRDAAQQWYDFSDLPPADREHLLKASAATKIMMRKKGSADTLKRLKTDLGYLIYLNRGYGPEGHSSELVDSNDVWQDAIDGGASREQADAARLEAIERNRVVRQGEVFEEPFRYTSLDNFLAETWLKNPWLRGEEEVLRPPLLGKEPLIATFKAPLKSREIAFGLSRAAFSARAHEKAVNEHKTTLENMAFYLGFPARYTQALVAQGLGHNTIDAVLAAHMYGEHGKTGDAIASAVPELVEFVKQGLWPAEKVREGTWENFGGVMKEVGAGYGPKQLTADEEVTLEKKAKMLVAITGEVMIDPTWFIGYGATSSTAAALGQVAKAAKMGRVKELTKWSKAFKHKSRFFKRLRKALDAGDLTEGQAQAWGFARLLSGPKSEKSIRKLLMKKTHEVHGVTLTPIVPDELYKARDSWMEVIDTLVDSGGASKAEADKIRDTWNKVIKVVESDLSPEEVKLLKILDPAEEVATTMRWEKALEGGEPLYEYNVRGIKGIAAEGSSELASARRLMETGEGTIEAIYAIPDKMNPSKLRKLADIGLEDAKALNKTIIDEAKTILSETGSLNEARKRIRVMLGKYAGPDAVKYMDEVVGEAWGQHGVTFRIPGMSEGVPLPAWSPLSAERLASYRTSMRLMSGLVRRGVIQKADALFDTGLLSKLGIEPEAAERFQKGVLFEVRERLMKGVIPNYRYSAGRKMDWAADDAARRLLDDIFGGPPVEAAGNQSRAMKGLQTEIDGKYEELDKIRAALDAPKPPSKTTSAYAAGKRKKWFEAQQERIQTEIAEHQAEIEKLKPAHKVDRLRSDIMEGKRERLTKQLGNILLIENKPMRSSAIRRFRKKLLKEMGDEKLLEFDPVLRTLEEGKWPEYMAKRGHERAPIPALREARFESKQADQMLNAYASLLDAATRSVGTSGKPMAKELTRMVPGIDVTPGGVLTMTGKMIPERELAGHLLQTVGKDFMDLLPANVIKAFPPEDLIRVQQVVTFAADEFAVMAEEAIRHGIDMKLVHDYYPGIYRNMDNIIPDTGPMASELGSGPSGMNPLMQKSLSSAQATAMGLKPERDILKMVMARRLAHEQAMSHTKMIHEVLGTMPPKAHGMPMPANMLSVKGPDGKTVRFSLGREIDDLSEVARGEESVMHWRKPEMKEGKWTGNWVEQDYAVSKEIHEGLNAVMKGLTDTSSPIGRQIASINTWFRGILTSPNPGYHMRNAMSNTVLAWMAGVRDPSHYGHAFMATLAESSPAMLKRVDDMIASLTKAGKTSEAENLSRFRAFRQRVNNMPAFTVDLGNGKTKTYTYGEFRKLAEDNGVMNKGFASVDLQASLDAELRWAASPEGVRAMSFMGIGDAAKKMVPGAAVGAAVSGAPGIGAAVGALGGALGPNGLLMKLGRDAGELVENQSRMAVFAQQIKAGVSPRVAAAHVDKYLYNYRNITEMEKGARQIFLFYTWMRKNMPRMVEELVTRPGRISAGTDKLTKTAERLSEDDWKGARTEYRQRYYAKMGGIPLPGQSKGKRSMLALDLPWRDLNMLDLNSEDLMEQIMSMTTPIAQVGLNGIAEALDKNLYGFGKGKTWVGNEMVESPGWLRDFMPGEAMVSGRKSGSGWKKKLGFEMRPDPILSAKTGKKEMKEYMPEHVSWWFNQIPMMAFAGKFTGDDLTKEEARAYQAMSYVFGWRQLSFDETASQEMNMFEVGEGVRREAPGRLTTARRKRSAAEDAKIGALIQKYRERKAAGKLRPKMGGTRFAPAAEWGDKPGEAQGQESIEQIRARALRAAARGQ